MCTLEGFQIILYIHVDSLTAEPEYSKIAIEKLTSSRAAYLLLQIVGADSTQPKGALAPSV